MIFLFCDEAGKDVLHVKGELHRYIVKVRRHQVGDEIAFRNKTDIKQLCIYKIVDISPKKVEFELLERKEVVVKSEKNLHVAWCVIDTKSIEKVLPTLNEIGVAKISFIYCDRSQRNIKLDFKRFERILEASMQQCGRSEFMEFDVYDNIKDFIAKYPDTKVFDFCDNVLNKDVDIKRFLVGCEGGFSQAEKEFLSKQERFRLDTPMVLRSESAVISIVSLSLV